MKDPAPLAGEALETGRKLFRLHGRCNNHWKDKSRLEIQEELQMTEDEVMDILFIFEKA